MNDCRPVTGKKRYWLFAGHHYPIGGFGDFKGSFDTFYEARTDAGRYIISCERHSLLPWCHIYDSHEDKLIEWDLDNGFEHE
jgi:hypothetical protein